MYYGGVLYDMRRAQYDINNPFCDMGTLCDKSALRIIGVI